MSAYAKLRRRRQIFVDAYVECGNASEAIRRAGYRGKNADVVGPEYVANKQVQAAIAERTEEAIAKAGARHLKLIEELCTLAYARLSQIRGEDGKPLDFAKLPAQLLAACESIEFEADGRVKRLKLAKTQGLRMLGEIMKAFPQVHEHSGRGGGPIETREVSDLEKARRIAYLLELGMRGGAESPDSAGEKPPG